MILRLATALILLSLKTMVFAEPRHSTPLTATRLTEILTEKQDRLMRFSITGTVSFSFETKHNPNDHSLVLNDSTGSIFLFGATNSIPTAGSVVSIKGSLGTSPTNEPWMLNLSVTKIAQSPTPHHKPIRLSEISDAQNNLRLIQTEATVIDVVSDDMGPEYDFILLKSGETLAHVACPQSSEIRKLIDAHIRIKGLVMHHVGGRRKYATPLIFINDTTDIEILTPPPSDAFSFPALKNDIYINPHIIAQLPKQSVTGAVLAAWSPNNVLMLSGDNRIMRLTLSEGEALPPYGSRITAVGHPETDFYHINLKRTRVRIDSPSTKLLETPETIPTANSLLYDKDAKCVKMEYYGKLITLQGIVKSLPSPHDNKPRIHIDCDGLTVPVDFTSSPSVATQVEIGSQIAVTGHCVYKINTWHPNEILPQISGVLLVLRKPGDITILTRPPWWTPRKLLIIIAILILSLLAVFIRNRILRRISAIRLNDRTQLAVELHDSLSQSLAGIAYQITAAQRDEDRHSADQKLATADQMLQSCRVELKNCLFDLRNDTIAEKTLDRAIRRTIEKFEDQADISIRFNVSRAPFDDSTVHAVLTIIRELVSNAITHGHAWTIRIAGTLDKGRLMFSVRDDGEGFDPKTAPGAAEGHFGLDGIRDRVKRLNGTFEIKPNASRGIKAIITLPVK